MGFDLYPLVKPLLFRLEAESAHNLVSGLGRLVQQVPPLLSVVSNLYTFEAPELHCKVFGLNFPNPVGLAAGFDKNGQLVRFLAALGFGALEIGSVTNEVNVGNDKPRLFRLEDDMALINRMGLNNLGPDSLREALLGVQLKIPLGVNVAKTNVSALTGDAAIEDVVSGVMRTAGLGDYLVLNLSCPNTKDGKTFENPAGLKPLLEMLKERNALGLGKPVLAKFSPNISLDDLGQNLLICEEFGISGYILTNTYTGRDGLRTSATRLQTIGRGGLSGQPLFQHAIQRVRLAHGILKNRKPLIGVGGVNSAERAYELIQAGASLVQLYTGLVYEGPGLVKRINQGLVEMLKRDGLTNISQAVGINAQ